MSPEGNSNCHSTNNLLERGFAYVICRLSDVKIGLKNADGQFQHQSEYTSDQLKDLAQEVIRIQNKTMDLLQSENIKAIMPNIPETFIRVFTGASFGGKLGAYVMAQPNCPFDGAFLAKPDLESQPLAPPGEKIKMLPEDMMNSWRKPLWLHLGLRDALIAVEEDFLNRYPIWQRIPVFLSYERTQGHSMTLEEDPLFLLPFLDYLELLKSPDKIEQKQWYTKWYTLISQYRHALLNKFMRRRWTNDKASTTLFQTHMLQGRMTTDTIFYEIFPIYPKPYKNLHEQNNNIKVHILFDILTDMLKEIEKNPFNESQINAQISLAERRYPTDNLKDIRYYFELFNKEKPNLMKFLTEASQKPDKIKELLPYLRKFVVTYFDKTASIDIGSEIDDNLNKILARYQEAVDKVRTEIDTDPELKQIRQEILQMIKDKMHQRYPDVETAIKDVKTMIDTKREEEKKIRDEQINKFLADRRARINEHANQVRR